VRLGWIVLAHDRPVQLGRLLDRLDAPGDRIFLHIDAAAPLDGFSSVLAGRENLEMLARRRSRWGTYGVMRATLDGMRGCRGAGVDYVSVISGQDYPIKPLAQLRDHLGRGTGTLFMTFWELPNPRWLEPDGGLARVEIRHYRIGGREIRVPGRLTPFVPRRRMPLGLTPYAGANWWTLPGAAAEYVLDFLDRHPQVERFYRRSALPAEGLVQTVLLNSHWRDAAVYGNLRHIVWPEGASHPVTLDATHLDELARSREFLARKFDDVEVLDLIDQRLLGEV
jgi:hypothetical protein